MLKLLRRSVVTAILRLAFSYRLYLLVVASFVVSTGFASDYLTILTAARAYVAFALLTLTHADMTRRFFAECAHEIQTGCVQPLMILTLTDMTAS